MKSLFLIAPICVTELEPDVMATCHANAAAVALPNLLEFCFESVIFVRFTLYQKKTKHQH